jgi:tetratricopeptide (TPR) repeat protein
LNGNFWVPESPIVRRDCYLAAGEFDTALRACEDWDVWLRFSHRYRLVGIPDVLIGYRVVSGSMSSNPQRMLDNRLAVLRKHLGDPPAQPGESAAHRAYASAWLRSAVEYLQIGDAAAACRCLHEGGRLHPPLLCDRTTYAELAQSSQPRGSEGKAEPGALAQQQTIVLDLIGRLAGETATAAGSRALLPQWQAQALWAMAQLHYRAGDRSAARAALLDALQLDRRLGGDRAFVGLLARTFVSSGQLAQLKRMAGRQRG